MAVDDPHAEFQQNANGRTEFRHNEDAENRELDRGQVSN
jgi:hypothetical protein